MHNRNLILHLGTSRGQRAQSVCVGAMLHVDMSCTTSIDLEVSCYGHYELPLLQVGNLTIGDMSSYDTCVYVQGS